MPCCCIKVVLIIASFIWNLKKFTCGLCENLPLLFFCIEVFLNIIYETSHQSRFDARYWMLGAGALGWPRGMVWGGRREEGSGWGTRVNLWWIHFDIWQNQYNIVKLKNKKKIKKNFLVIISSCNSLLKHNENISFLKQIVQQCGMDEIMGHTK